MQGRAISRAFVVAGVAALVSVVLGVWARPAVSASARPKAGAVEDAQGSVAKDERWLAHALDDALCTAVGPQQREALTGRLAKVALAWAACGRGEAFGTPVQLLHAMRGCKYLALLEAGDEDDKALAQWLLGHRVARRIVFRALDDVPKPGKSLKALRELQAKEPDRLAEYPNLAAAFVTSRPRRFYKPQPEPATTLESFVYFTDPKRKFRYDIKKMPFELSRYVADTRLSIPERTWAARRYLRVRNLGTAYFHVQYDYDYFRKREPKKISKVDYTMQNLAKVGGVCIDQAYYASEACKAVGVPSAIVYGRGVSGISHAWFTYFQMNAAGTSASWKGGAGRYASNLYFTGSVDDPATGEKILDSELVLVGSAALLPLRRREEAEAATALARLVAEACVDGNAPADLAPLRELASDYEKRLAPRPKAPPLDASWVQAKGPLDAPLAESLIRLAVKRNLAYAPAWELITELRKSDRLSAGSLDRFLGILIEKTAQAFPELSCRMVLQLAPTLADEARREKAYRRALGVYGRRPDLKGKILMAMAADCVTAGQNAKAVTIYQTAATQCLAVPDIVLPAAARAEELLVADNKQAAAMRLYYTLFRRTAKEKDTAEEIRKQTPHYQLGTRLAEMLREAGKDAAAEKITAGL